MTALPRPSEEHPRRAMLHGIRPVLRTGVGRWWDLRVHRQDRAPTHGPVIFACKHVGWLDDPLGIFPEGTRGAGTYDVLHHGATYLALVSGAPVVPVTMIGTRVPGGGLDSLPPRGSRIDVVVGEAWRTAPTPWPRTREHTLATSALLWQHLRDELSRALSLTGRALPGPLPAGDIEDDPETGFVEHHQGAS